MTLMLLLVLLAFVGYSAYRAVRDSNKVLTIADFFSFGSEIDPSILRRSFQATNISFTTSFVALYLFAFTQGIWAIATPICFCIGILVYAYLFLPRQVQILAQGKRYPEMLAHAAGAPGLRKFISVFVLLSLWLFTFAEVQGLNLFLNQLWSDTPSLSRWIPIVLVVALAFYVSRNGYRATTSNDRFQMRLILVGAVAVLALTVLSIKQTGWSSLVHHFEQAKNPFGGFAGTALFLFETLLGFVFSQLLYYDNWQRLSFYAVELLKQRGEDGSAPPTGAVLEDLAKLIRREYLLGSIALLLVFTSPIFLGLATLAGGTTAGDMESLAVFFKRCWVDAPVLGPVLIILAFAFMLSALLSTAESYVVAISNCLLEDLCGVNTKDSLPGAKLDLARILTAVAVVSLVPFLLIQPSFDTLFVYLFYSANGFVGPLLFLTLRWQLNQIAVVTSIVLGFLYPLPVFFESYSAYAPYPGIIPVIGSLLLVGATSRGVQPRGNLASA